MWVKHDVEQTKPEVKGYVQYDSIYVVQEQAALTNGDRNQNNSYPGSGEVTGEKLEGMFQEAGHVLSCPLNGVTQVDIWKNHQGVHLRSVHFSVRMLHLSG